MLRIFTTALFFTGCQGLDAVEQDLSGFLDRNPALRTLQFGYSHALTAPNGKERLGKKVVGDNHAFLLWTDGDCPALGIHTIEDAEADIRAPRQVIDSCDRGTNEQFSRVLAADHGMLIVGTHLFRSAPDGYEFDQDLRNLLREDQFALGAALLDERTLVLNTSETAYLFVDDGGWTQVDRLDSGYSGVKTDGDRLAASNRVYQRNGDTWNLVFQLNTGGVVDLGGDVLLGSASNGIVIYDWDASRNTYARRSSRIRQSRGAKMVRNRIAYFYGRTLRIMDSDWNLMAADEVGTRGDTYGLTVNGDQGVVNRGSQEIYWVMFTDEDPVAGEVLRDNKTLSKGEEARFDFEVPVGTRSLVVTLAGTGDADLYVRKEGMPTRTVYDCSPYRAGSDEVCTFREPAPGTWHVGVHGFDASSDVTLVASVD